MNNLTNEERERLFNDNINLAYWVLKGYRPPDGETYEDLVQEAKIGLWKACLFYDASRTAKFSTYAVMAIRRNVNLYISKKRVSVVDEIDPYSDHNDTSKDVSMEFEDDFINDSLLKDKFEKLNDRDKQIILLFQKGYSNREIGEMFGVSHETIRKRINNFGYSIIRNKMKERE